MFVSVFQPPQHTATTRRVHTVVLLQTKKGAQVRQAGAQQFTHSFNNVHTHSRGDSRYSCTCMCLVNLSCRIASLFSDAPSQFKTYSTISTGGYVGSFGIWRRPPAVMYGGASSSITYWHLFRVIASCAYLRAAERKATLDSAGDGVGIESFECHRGCPEGACKDAAAAAQHLEALHGQAPPTAIKWPLTSPELRKAIFADKGHVTT